jgi:hypothetical protein
LALKKKEIMMLSSFKFAFQGLRAATLLGLLVCGIQSVANAGVLTYNSVTRAGTFDPSSPSTFTFTNFTGLPISKSYSQVKVFAKWNGPGTYPGAFALSAISLSSPGTTSAPSDVNFLASTPADSDVFASAFVVLNSPVTSTNLADVQLSLTVPTLTVSDGWNLKIALLFTDGGANTNPTDYQTVSALNGGSSVPEPGTTAVAGGLFALAIFVQRRRAKRTANVDSTTV